VIAFAWYCLGFLTVPVLTAVAVFFLNAEPRRAWKGLVQRPLCPAWSWYARASGATLARFPPDSYFWKDAQLGLADLQREARRAKRVPWLPLVLWPPRLWRLAQLATVGDAR